METRTCVGEGKRLKEIYEIMHGPNCYNCEFCEEEPNNGYSGVIGDKLVMGDYNYYCIGEIGKRVFLTSLGDQESYIRRPADCPQQDIIK